VKEWLAADADAREAADGSLADGVSCDDAGCVVEAGGGGFITQALRGDALADDCKRAVLVVTARQPPVDCGASVIDLARLRRQGAKAPRRAGDVAQARWICGRCGQTKRLRSAVVAGSRRRGRERQHDHLTSITAARAGCDAVGDRPPG